MKLRASILVFPVTIFLIETAIIPFEVKKSCARVSCTKTKQAEMKCHASKKDKPRCGGKCNEMPECSVCPICFMFTLQSQYEWTFNNPTQKNKYPLINTTYLSTFVSTVWKPPNT